MSEITDLTKAVEKLTDTLEDSFGKDKEGIASMASDIKDIKKLLDDTNTFSKRIEYQLLQIVGKLNAIYFSEP